MNARITASYAAVPDAEQQARDASVAAGGWLDVPVSDEDPTVIGRVRWLAVTGDWMISSGAWPGLQRRRDTYDRAVAMVRRLEETDDLESARRCR